MPHQLGSSCGRKISVLPKGLRLSTRLAIGAASRGARFATDRNTASGSLRPAGRLQPLHVVAASNPGFKTAGTLADSCNRCRIIVVFLRDDTSGEPLAEKKCRSSARGEEVILPPTGKKSC